MLDSDSSIGTRISGELDIYFPNYDYEIGIPLLYRHANVATDENPRFGSVKSIDIVLRKYFGDNTSSTKYYYGGFVRYAELNGISTQEKSVIGEREFKSVTKTGAGIELGLKKTITLLNTPFYWGASIFYGQYISSKNNIVDVRSDYMISEIYDEKTILDFHFAKIGYVF